MSWRTLPVENGLHRKWSGVRESWLLQNGGVHPALQPMLQCRSERKDNFARYSSSISHHTSYHENALPDSFLHDMARNVGDPHAYQTLVKIIGRGRDELLQLRSPWVSTRPAWPTQGTNSKSGWFRLISYPCCQLHVLYLVPLLTSKGGG